MPFPQHWRYISTYSQIFNRLMSGVVALTCATFSPHSRLGRLGSIKACIGLNDVSSGLSKLFLTKKLLRQTSLHHFRYMLRLHLYHPRIMEKHSTYHL